MARCESEEGGGLRQTSFVPRFRIRGDAAAAPASPHGCIVSSLSVGLSIGLHEIETGLSRIGGVVRDRLHRLHSSLLLADGPFPAEGLVMSVVANPATAPDVGDCSGPPFP